MAVFPNKKHEFSAAQRAVQKGGQRVTQQGGLAVCITRQASGRYNRAGWQIAH